MAQQTDHIGDTNKMMTALDWFVKEIQTKLINDGEVNYVELAKEAKAMEKEQIIKAACYEPFLGDFPRKEGEHYYNQTYNK